MQRKALVLSLLFGSLVPGCKPSPVSSAPATKLPPKEQSVTAIRRMCLQRGLGARGTGGGSIVFATGAEGQGVGIDTVYGEHAVAPAAGALCEVPEQRLRVCLGGGGEVPVTIGLEGGPAGTVPRGAPLAFYEYVSGGGPTRAIVGVGGKVRFLDADDVCHPDGVVLRSRATSRFKMDLSAPGGPRAFRPRSTDTIRRIVIHNTEVPLLQTLHIFERPEANTSAHVVIDRDGSYYRVIEDGFAAFHAGSSKDGLGGHNSTSLGIEVVAYDDPMYGGESKKFSFFSDAQKKAVIELVDFWMAEYKLAIAPEVFANRATNAGYADLEYSRAALTIHRLTKADRGTDCPRLLFPQSPEGDEQFFRWRETTFDPAVQQRRSAATPEPGGH